MTIDTALPAPALATEEQALNPLENDPPVVVHLGNMPIAEEDAYMRAELKRRFEVSERLRSGATEEQGAPERVTRSERDDERGR